MTISVSVLVNSLVEFAFLSGELESPAIADKERAMLRSFATLLALCSALVATVLASADTSLSQLKPMTDTPTLISLNISYWQGPASTVLFPTQRSGYSVAQLPTISTDDDHPDEIIIMGGLTTPDHVFGDVWKSLDEGNSWTQISTTYPNRYQAAVCIAAGSEILAIGGWLQSNTPGGIIPAATDSYMSRSRGVDWERISTNQPFTTSPNTQCSLDNAGTWVYLWLGDSKFSNIQLWRTRLTGSGFVAWEGISTPASDGKFLLDRNQYAVRFLPGTNQLVIAGGYGVIQTNIIKETLTLSIAIDAGQNVSAWTRAAITANWPSSLNMAQSYFAVYESNVYLYTPASQDRYASTDRVLWVPGSAAFDTWIPVDQNSTCAIAWSYDWGNSISGVLTSYTQGTPRLVFLDQQMINPTLLMALDNLNQESAGIVVSESFHSVSMCAAPDHNPGGHPAWMIIGIIAGAAVLVIGCIVFFVCFRRNRNGTGINSPLLAK